MKEISVNKLQDMIKDKVVELIDVRENNEYQYCKIEGSKHIRMNDIPSSIHDRHAGVQALFGKQVSQLKMGSSKKLRLSDRRDYLS